VSNDDIRVGDRFRYMKTAGIAVCTGPKIPGTELYPCEWTTDGYAPYACYLAEPCWIRLRREDPTPTIEERRAALRVGQVITDPALLTKGMRVLGASGLSVTLLEPREHPTGWNDADTPRFLSDEACAEYGVTFLGWAQEEKAGEVEAKPPAGKPDPTPTGLTARPQPEAPSVYPFLASIPGQPVLICDATRCEVHHDPSDPACVRAKHRTPPRGLPFKRHPDCYMPSIHVVEVMCMGCEAAIATEATDADRNAAHERALQAPSRADACPPSPSGLGGTVGPILAKLR
jgi:hypothetical protein